MKNVEWVVLCTVICGLTIFSSHDFEALVGDFGLARWQPDGEMGVETRYLAPEYTQSRQIAEKADVYSFGIVLRELVTGRKVVDINKPKGQQCLCEWIHPAAKGLYMKPWPLYNIFEVYAKDRATGANVMTVSDQVQQEVEQSTMPNWNEITDVEDYSKEVSSDQDGTTSRKSN